VAATGDFLEVASTTQSTGTSWVYEYSVNERAGALKSVSGSPSAAGWNANCIAIASGAHQVL
jgi:hypothetical protein